jgi:hypothetical protein
MSRAFVKEDGDGPPPRYSLPAPDDPGFPLAAARALLTGANNGDTGRAEEATGHLWGDPLLVAPMRQLLALAIERGDDRTEVLIGRFLRAAGVRSTD